MASFPNVQTLGTHYKVHERTLQRWAYALRSIRKDLIDRTNKAVALRNKEEDATPDERLEIRKLKEQTLGQLMY